ncbi:MAG TPA: hypothetical protein VGR41_02280 [Actinomycetota bacterium]|jgi:FlaG/FlaF family flagellin (archaellin)|nr:hypothetical protein [Actinomycetota bacterium]
MKAPGLVPDVVARDRVVVLPDAAPKRRWPVIAGVLLLAGWTAAIAGIGVYLWQRGEVRDRDAIITRTQSTNDDLTVRLAGVDGQIADLQTEIDSTKAKLESAQNGLDVAQGTNIEGQNQAGILQAQLDGLKGRLRTTIGPRLHHGMHIGYIVAVNAAESRVVLDIGRWFTGRAARQAAIADGAIHPSGHLPDRRYLRNPDHSWRVVHVRSLTHVTLRHYQGADGPTVVTISTLASIFDSGRPADETVRLDPFWVMVDDGKVIEITEQQYTAP